VHWQALEKVLLAAGFRFAPQEGSHRSYVRPWILRPIVIPAYKAVLASIIRINLRTAGISREDYSRLLEEEG